MGRALFTCISNTTRKTEDRYWDISSIDTYPLPSASNRAKAASILSSSSPPHKIDSPHSSSEKSTSPSSLRSKA